MGNLFGGRPSTPVATPTTGTALADQPRPMPDPDSPLARRVARQERSRASIRSGRAATDLTRRTRPRLQIGRPTRQQIFDAAPESLRGQVGTILDL